MNCTDCGTELTTMISRSSRLCNPCDAARRDREKRADVETESIYQDAIEQWGPASQLRMLQEECGELIAAINHADRGRITRSELASEIADVMIMAEQARLIVGAVAVDKKKAQKLKRLAGRLEAGNG
jgi:NTP pyrophosphatase (non-canonical NTP hydrolase)